MMYVLSFLMVSNVKYISFKKMDLFRRHPFHTLVAWCLIFVVVATAPNIMGFLLMAAYVASGPISTIMYHRRAALTPKGRERDPAPEAYQLSGFGPGRRGRGLKAGLIDRTCHYLSQNGFPR